MTRVLVKCPLCSAIDRIDVDEAIIEQSERGVTAVNVEKNYICPHSFVAYIDTNFIVRDCFITDFKVELPQITIDASENFLLKKNFDQYLILINIKPLTLSYILRCCLLKKKFIFINDMTLLNSHLLGFLKYIFSDSFDYELTILSTNEYKKKKKEYKKYIVFSNNRIKRDKLDILKEKQVKVEKFILQKFQAENDPESSLIILRNEIYKIFKIITSIIDYSVNNNKPINIKLIVDQILEKFTVTISKSYLKFLILVMKEYFKIEFADTNINDFIELI